MATTIVPVSRVVNRYSFMFFFFTLYSFLVFFNLIFELKGSKTKHWQLPVSRMINRYCFMFSFLFVYWRVQRSKPKELIQNNGCHYLVGEQSPGERAGALSPFRHRKTAAAGRRRLRITPSSAALCGAALCHVLTGFLAWWWLGHSRFRILGPDGETELAATPVCRWQLFPHRQG